MHCCYYYYSCHCCCCCCCDVCLTCELTYPSSLIAVSVSGAASILTKVPHEKVTNALRQLCTYQVEALKKVALASATTIPENDHLLLMFYNSFIAHYDVTLIL